MSDLISRQAAIEAMEAVSDEICQGQAEEAIQALPPVEPPKKVVAQVDIDEIVKRIKEEYEIKDRPKGEWQTKTVGKFCAPDCWCPGASAIDGTWNEEEGSWLELQDGFCSECGKQDEQYAKHKYCPNCGAKMNGEEKGHE